jgi:hypothetical protein
MSSSPITNTGIDRPISTATVENLSNRLRALVALMMPTVSPAISQCARRAAVDDRHCGRLAPPDPAAEPARHPHQAGVVKMLI